MNKVKDDLEYFKEYDYVIKVDVVQIIINRIDNLKSDDIEIDDKSYRWKGLFKDKTNNVIKYDKAWNANKIYFNIRRIIWTQIMKHPWSECPMHYLKCMVINQKVKHILTVKLQMVEWNILKKC